MKRNRPADTFDQFWTNYPRKVARKHALKAWIALDPDLDLIVTILAALQWQRELWTDLTFCPYPATWIRGERWTDEKPTKQTNKAPAPVMTRFASLGMHHRKT